MDEGCYLIIVRYDPEHDVWVVDEDSRHILEGDGGAYAVQELEVEILRPLTGAIMKKIPKDLIIF